MKDIDLPIQGKKIYQPQNRETIIPRSRLQDLDIENLSIPIPNGRSLYAFQDPAIRRMLYFYKHLDMKGAYNGYDPGLGKTCMAIVTHANILKARRILVACPSVLRDKWTEEIRLWDIDDSPGKPVSVHAIYSARGAIRPITAKWCVVSYTLLLKENVFKRLDEVVWDAIIFDEAKELKSMRSKRTRLALALWNRARRGLWMDGTPVTKTAQDLYPACHCMMPDYYTDEDEFCERYCLKKSVPWGAQGWEYFGGKNLEELRDHIRANFFLRKRKEDVLADLPETVYQKILLDCGKFDKELTKEQERQVLEAVAMGKDPSECAKPQDKKHISERRLEAGLKTLEAGKDIIGTLVEGNVPVMVIAYHRAVIDQIMQIFKAYNPVKIDGSVIGPAKEKAYKAFNSGLTNMIVLQIKSAVGIDLQHRCSEAVYVETSYDPTQVRQSLDRIRRIGQHASSIRAQFLVAKGSVDEQVFEIMKTKLEMIDQLVVTTDE